MLYNHSYNYNPKLPTNLLYYNTNGKLLVSLDKKSLTNGITRFHDRYHGLTYCHIDTKESYLLWVESWKMYYKNLSESIRYLKNHRKYEYAKHTYTYVTFDPEADKYVPDIMHHHASTSGLVSWKLMELQDLATKALILRRNMKLASYGKKQLDLRQKAA